MVSRIDLSHCIDEDDGDGHEDGDDDEGYLQHLLDDLFTLDAGQAALLEQAGTIFLMMVVMVMMFCMITVCHNYLRILTINAAIETRILVAENHSVVV